MRSLKSIALVAGLASSAASAQREIVERDSLRDRDGSTSSELTGRTVGGGAFVLHPELGYPAVSLSLLSGVTDRFDFGGRFTLGYGAPFGFLLEPRSGAQAILRFNFVDVPMFSFGMRLEPGVLFGFAPTDAATLIMPVGLDFGIHPHPVVNVAFGADVGFGAVLRYGGGVGFVMPVTAGPGVELNLTQRIQLTVNTRFGGYGYVRAPFVVASNGFGLRATIGLAFRI